MKTAGAKSKSKAPTAGASKSSANSWKGPKVPPTTQKQRVKAYFQWQHHAYPSLNKNGTLTAPVNKEKYGSLWLSMPDGALITRSHWEANPRLKACFPQYENLHTDRHVVVLRWAPEVSQCSAAASQACLFGS
jgi:hypothetical protein